MLGRRLSRSRAGQEIVIITLSGPIDFGEKIAAGVLLLRSLLLLRLGRIKVKVQGAAKVVREGVVEEAIIEFIGITNNGVLRVAVVA